MGDPSPKSSLVIALTKCLSALYNVHFKNCKAHLDTFMLNVCTRFYTSKKTCAQKIWPLIEHKRVTVSYKLAYYVEALACQTVQRWPIWNIFPVCHWKLETVLVGHNLFFPEIYTGCPRKNVPLGEGQTFLGHLVNDLFRTKKLIKSEL